MFNKSHISFLTRKTTAGFTLIELLVVIAIISLLVSILVPSLNSAKELARRALCAANLHAIGIATHLYDQEQEFFPRPNGGSAAMMWRTQGTITFEIDQGERPLNSYLEITDVIDNPARTEPAPDVMSQARCPSDRLPITEFGQPYFTWYEMLGNNYYFNINLAYESLYDKRLIEIRSPSTTILNCDHTVDFGYSTWAHMHTRFYLLGPHQPGTGWSNAAFVDGHVEFIRLQDDWDEASVGNWLKGDGWSLIVE